MKQSSGILRIVPQRRPIHRRRCLNHINRRDPSLSPLTVAFLSRASYSRFLELPLLRADSCQISAMKFSRVAVLLLLVFITQYLLAEASDDQKQRRRRKGKGQDQGQSHDGGKSRKAESGSSVGAEGDKQRKGKGSAPKQGRFLSRDQAQCKWVLRGDEDADKNLHVECKKGPNDYWCDFTGKPSACAKYSGDAKTYWKQITRTLKKQKALCSEPSAVLKSSLCRSTKAAHLKMTASSLRTTAAPGKEQPNAPTPLSTADPDAPDIDKIAAEYCNERWGSVCKFMLSAIQG
ncbi:fibroblast growth factor-binding protein 1-like [Carcharodon carcharias]|uniref:fibroblast growth factor-binding protein 1-like n=1 Tax=Carcharodon carcharias TaxID=13397 RepID=UPI001B7ECCD4|nr:fibroblast growth factor-binding protein 1-like [Carcharodon carcharias]